MGTTAWIIVIAVVVGLYFVLRGRGARTPDGAGHAAGHHDGHHGGGGHNHRKGGGCC